MQQSIRALVCVSGPVMACALLSACTATTVSPTDTAPSAALEDLGGAPADPGSSNEQAQSLAERARQSADDLAMLFGGDAPQRSRRETTDPQPGAQAWQPPSARAADTTGSEDIESGGGEQPQRDVRTETPAVGEQATRVDPVTPIDPVALMLERLERDATDPERALAASILAHAVRTYISLDDGSMPTQDLSPAERELFEALEPVIESLASGDRADAPARVGQAMEGSITELADVLPVHIRDAALATDIYGFAAYRPFHSNAFMAGRTNRVLLYTEPSRFVSTATADPASQGSAANPGAYEVALGLELRLFNERGSMIAWRRPEERVAIRSDRPRGEIYLGTVIDLPETLTVGRYQLKVIVRDLADGSEDERVIPIEIVADPRLTSRSTRDR